MCCIDHLFCHYLVILRLSDEPIPAGLKEVSNFMLNHMTSLVPVLKLHWRVCD